MTNNSFFDEFRETSLVKAEIVAKYFWAWAKVIMPQAKKRGTNIAYIDLFSGPGRYQDGSKSTPLLILERAIADVDMREKLITIFNDKNSDNTDSLQQAINSLPSIKTLKHKPQVLNTEIGREVVQVFPNIPTLFFIDPWGYKGLSLQLISSTIAGWGCDCIFFFNYNRINSGLNNSRVETHINELFGKEQANLLREQILNLQPDERESKIVQAIGDALKRVGGSYFQHFCFKKEDINRTSHYLIFVSKNNRGHSIMKDIMAKKSSLLLQGVPSFQHDQKPVQLSLFDSQPINQLEDMLLDEFAGQTMTMLQVYEQHHVGKPYIERNYKDALLLLEEKGKIVVDPPGSKRQKRKGKLTFADRVKVTFPPK
ncbi:MAG: three-Cys-motif partner protein TcmP [Cyanobacteriota bacterium]|nr:three-Cys-motif partner protein TcmP [Cyanobacteriota bacterium]